MVKSLTGCCPICSKNFQLHVEEALITDAPYHPVVFSTQHCDHALICYVDANFNIRMIEIANIALSPGSTPAPTLAENGSADMAEVDIGSLTDAQRVILECNISKDEFKAHQFPNIIEKQIFYHILKHGTLSLERLYEELKIVQKALNFEVTPQTIEPLIEKYIEAGLLTKTEI
jgi:hypothetical protein